MVHISIPGRVGSIRNPLDQLRRNDPKVKYVAIDLEAYQTKAQLEEEVEAMERCDSITIVDIKFGGRPLAPALTVESLAGYIERSDCLESIFLRGKPNSGSIYHGQCGVLMRSIRRVQRVYIEYLNIRVQDLMDVVGNNCPQMAFLFLDLCWFSPHDQLHLMSNMFSDPCKLDEVNLRITTKQGQRGYIEILKGLEKSSLVKKLLVDCDSEMAALEIQKMLQKNTSVEKLVIQKELLNEHFVASILIGLEGNNVVKAVSFWWNFNKFELTCALALQAILEENHTIEKINFGTISFDRTNILPILEGLQVSPFVGTLEFEYADFENCSLELLEMLGSCGITTLTLRLTNCSNFLRGLPSILGNQTTINHLTAGLVSNAAFAALFNVVSTSPLKSLLIECPRENDSIETLASSVPNMHNLETLSFYHCSRAVVEESLQNLILAIKRNPSLMEVKGEIIGEDRAVFDGMLGRELNGYLYRNKLFAKALANPKSIFMVTFANLLEATNDLQNGTDVAFRLVRNASSVLFRS